LSDDDKKYVTFVKLFENEFVNQGYEEDRSISGKSRFGMEVVGAITAKRTQKS
jgi:vacuolar-type H+-ATPase subunit B/Vma2